MTQAGIAVLVGVMVGVGITYFFLQQTIRRQENALEQAMARLTQKDQDQNQQLNEAMAKMESEYEQQIARTIERYQDSHSEQMQALEAEYEARMAALTSVSIQEPLGQEPSPEPAPETVEPAPVTAPEVKPVGSFSVLPDPWGEQPQTIETDAAATSSLSPASVDRAVQSVVVLGAEAALSRKAAVKAVPKLGKLARDPDPDVRLAAVNALQQSGSAKAVPFLRRALKDSDSRIVAAANAALSRFKGAKIPKPRKPRLRAKRRSN